MGYTTDFNKNEFVQEALQAAIRDVTRQVTRNAHANMLRGLLQTKFGSLPKWADERLESAKSVQIERWSKKILVAETLEGVLGKK